MTQDCYYVYVLLDPRRPGEYRYGRWTFDYEPFYVGKGKGSRARRHFRDYERKSKTQGYNTRKTKRIAAIHLATNGEPIIKAIKNLSEERAYELEALVVNAIGRGRKGPLLNLTDGGIGGTGAKRLTFTPERSAAMSKRLKETFAERDETYWEKRAKNVSISYSLMRETNPEAYAKIRATNSRCAKARWSGSDAEAKRIAQSEMAKRVIAERYANMSDLDKAKFKLKQRLGHLLRRLQSDEDRVRVKGLAYAFIDKSRHRSLAGFVRATEKFLVSHKLVS